MSKTSCDRIHLKYSSANQICYLLANQISYTYELSYYESTGVFFVFFIPAVWNFRNSQHHLKSVKLMMHA